VLKKGLLLVLLALAALAAAARPCAADEGEMTDAEARAARALALRFMGRLRETDDFGPLVEEFFPAGFDERLRRFVGEAPGQGEEDFLVGFDRAALLRAEPNELRRAYVALLNFWNQHHLLGDAALDYARLQCEAAGEARPCGWGPHYGLARGAVPEEAFRIAAADPLLGAMLDIIGDDGEAEEGEVAEARVNAAAVRDPARLRSFTERLERCVPLLREAVAKLRADARSYAAAHSATKSYEDMVAAHAELKVYHLSDETLEEASFGLPAGALLIRARVYPYEMAIARAGGRLTILAVYPDFDGD
jgi:hypothetical protein